MATPGEATAGTSGAELQTRLRALPSLDALLRSAEGEALLANAGAQEGGREAAVRALREAVAHARARILAGAARVGLAGAADAPGGAPGAARDPGLVSSGAIPAAMTDLDGASPATLIASAARILAANARLSLRRVVNGTGVVLHTGLGRAVLSPEARAAVADVARGYSLLEVDRASGERGQRESAAAALLTALTGAEAATVVNNNAAATLLMLAALARGREVIVARGQLVEIGGSYRIPEVMEASGARLREVGATNKVHRRDYERAIGPETAAILLVHTSNFRVVGFTAEVGVSDLGRLARERGLRLLHDVGSGSLLPRERWREPGLTGPDGAGDLSEPPVGESVAAGADVVCMSGDKVLGGPQAGILLGKAEAVRACRDHPLYRAVRADKLQLAALEATLRLYREGDPVRRVTALGQLFRPAGELRAQAEALAARASGITGLVATAVPCASEPGSGALPATSLPSHGVALRLAGLSAVALAARLRAAEPPVFTRIVRDEVLIDVRTLLEGDEGDILAALAGAHHHGPDAGSWSQPFAR